MSKGQEAFGRFLEHCDSENSSYCINGDDLKDIAITEKELMAFDIIKEKKVDIATFNTYQSVIEYNWSIRFEKHKRKELIQEEFDLLKEMLK